MDDLFLWAHLGFLAVALYGIIDADSQAFAWMRGKTPTIAEHHLKRTHWVVTIGLAGLILTGLYLYWPMRAYLYGQAYFITKMVFVLALLVNSFFIERLMPLASQFEHKNLPAWQKRILTLSGGVSTLSWLGAVLLAILQFGWPF
jgi:hypothetical protein